MDQELAVEIGKAPKIASQVEQDESLLPAVAAALSHDINSIVGTIGRKARLLVNASRTQILNASKVQKESQKSRNVEVLEKNLEILEKILDVVKDLYRTNELVRDSVRNGSLPSRHQLAKSITNDILGQILELQRNARLIGLAEQNRMRSGDMDALRRSIIRLDKIMRSIVNSLDDGADPLFVPTNIANHVDFAKEAVAEQLALSGGNVYCQGVGSIVADQGCLLTLFINLFSNSMKYRSSERTPEVKVSIEKFSLVELRGKYTTELRSRLAPSDWYVVQVADNGRGIERSHWSRIFDFGYRANAQADAAEDGFGLGLTRCREVMKIHRGKILLENSTPAGTTFSLVFPSDPREVVVADGANAGAGAAAL